MGRFPHQKFNFYMRFLPPTASQCQRNSITSERGPLFSVQACPKVESATTSVLLISNFSCDG